MPDKVFTEEACQKVVAAIKAAEKMTSGEIRVHVDKHCAKNVLDSAANAFAELEMHKTAQRNGILFYFATEDRKYAVIGDAG